MTSTSAFTCAAPPSCYTTDAEGRYGFAELDGDVVLVQLIPPRTPSTHEAHVFRHNFVSVFSYSHTQTLGSGLLEILENDEKRDKPRCWLEEDTATVFVAQDVMARFISLKDMLVPSPLGRVESGVRCIATVASAVAR